MIRSAVGLLLWLGVSTPVRADILPPMPTGFVAEVPDPPRLPPHPVPPWVGVGLGLVCALGVGTALLLRRRARQDRPPADPHGDADDNL